LFARLVAKLSVPGLIIAAAVWFVLFVILSIPLWVAFVAGGGTLLVYAALVGEETARHRAG